MLIIIVNFYFLADVVKRDRINVQINQVLAQYRETGNLDRDKLNQLLDEKKQQEEHSK